MAPSAKHYPRQEQMAMTNGKIKEKSVGDTKTGRPTPRKITPARLENIALHHLDRFATSANNLRRVLSRRAQKSAYHHEDTDLEECATWIDNLISRYQECGLLDDPAYARAQAISHNRRGKSLRAIRALLSQKGVTAPDIDVALEGLNEDHVDADLAAAIAYARRRRIGPYRTKDIDDKGLEKELSALARSGFSYGIARRIVTAETVEDIDPDR